jgi:hypothetical protein
MKTYIVVIVTLIATMLFSLSTAHAEQNRVSDSSSTAALIKAKALVMRLDIINATDQSGFTKAEKRTLRKESHHIKGDLKELHGGRYIRTSLLVLIVLVPLSVFQLTEQ